jgi:hypothetical protein
MMTLSHCYDDDVIAGFGEDELGLIRGGGSDLLQVTDKLLSHNVVSSTPRHERDSNSLL